MSPENTIFESVRSALKKAQEYSIKLDPKTNPDVQSDEFIGTTGEELVKLRNELNSVLLNTNSSEQERLVRDLQKRAMGIRDRLAEISLSDAFQRHVEKNRKLISDIESIHSAIKSLNTERIPAILEGLDPAKNGGITSNTFGEKLKPAISLYEKARRDYSELLTSQLKPAEQLLKLKTIQQQFLAAETALHEIALRDYESDILIVQEKSFVDNVVLKIKVETPPDNAEILAAMPGANQEEKIWNYRLLSVYSDIFSTEDITSLKGKPETPKGPGLMTRALRGIGLGSLVDGADLIGKGKDFVGDIIQDAKELTGLNKETVTLMDSIKKALDKQKHNGPDVKNRQGVFLDKSKVDLKLDQSSTPGDLKSQAEYPDSSVLAKHLSEIARYANDIETLIPIYVSLVQEHYLTLLVKRDYNNRNKEGRADLPKSLQERYDILYENADPEKQKLANTFTQTGLDSDGFDWKRGPDQFPFPDETTKMQFITSSIKLLPIFDTVDEAYLDPKLEGLDAIIATGGDITQYCAEVFTNGPAGLRESLEGVIGEGWTAAMGIFAGLHSPKAVLLSRLVSMFVERGEDRWYDLPLIMMILRLIRQARVLAILASPFRGLSGMIAKIPGKYTLGISKLFHIPQGILWVAEKIGGGDGSSNMADYWRAMTRVASERTIYLGDDISIKGSDALNKLDPEMRKRYDVMIKIIDMRVAAGVGQSIEVDAYGSTHENPKKVKLSGISLEFGQLLKDLIKNQLSENYCAKAIKYKGSKKSEKEAFKNDHFTPDKTVWIYMMNDMTASQDWKEQLMTGNIPDASHLNDSFGRIFGMSQLNVPGTQMNWLKTWYNLGIGQWIEEYTWRFNMPSEIGGTRIPMVPGLTSDARGNIRNPAQALYHNRLHADGWWWGRGSVRNAGAFLDAIAKHLPETLKVELIDRDAIHHDVEALEKYGYKLNEDDTFETVHFDQANEKKLLKNCHFNGQFPKNGWKFAVITMVVMARGSKGDLATDHAPKSLDDGHHHFDLKKCADAYDKLSETDKKSVDALFNKILPPNHGVPQKVDRAELMKLGKILGILPTIAGAVDGIDNSGKARTEISRLESIYFKIGEVSDDAQMTTDFMSGYEKCFRDHAKEFGAGYDPDNHVKMIHETRATLCYMHRELMAEVESGKVTTEAKIQEKIKEYVKKKGTHMVDNWYTQHPTAKVEYDKILKKLIDKSLDVQSMATDKDTQLKSLEGRIRGGSMRTDDAVKAEVDRIVADLTDDQKKSLAEKMGIPEDKRKTAKSAVDALKTRYIDDLNTKIQSLHTSIQNPASIADTKELVRRLKTYRCYPHSCETGRADVQMAYAELANRLQALINNPKEYYSLYEHLNNSSFNPESGAAADPDSQNRLDVAYNSVLETGKKKTDEFKNEAKKAIKKATDDLQKVFKKTYADIAALRTALDTAKQNFEQALESVENKFGVDLCMEGGTNKIEEAKEAEQKASDILDAIERSAGEAQALFTRIQGGSLKTETKISDAIAAFERDPLNQAYRVCFGAQFSTMMETAKRLAGDAREAARTPNTPPLAPETPPQNPSENPNEVLKNEMAEFESTEAYRSYAADRLDSTKYRALIAELADPKYTNLRNCYRCADRVLGLGENKLNKYGPFEIFNMLKVSTVDANGTVILELPSGASIDVTTLTNAFPGKAISPVGLMMKMDMNGIGSVELRTAGQSADRFELHIRR